MWRYSSNVISKPWLFWNKISVRKLFYALTCCTKDINLDSSYFNLMVLWAPRIMHCHVWKLSLIYFDGAKYYFESWHYITVMNLIGCNACWVNGDVLSDLFFQKAPTIHGRGICSFTIRGSGICLSSRCSRYIDFSCNIFNEFLYPIFVTSNVLYDLMSILQKIIFY